MVGILNLDEEVRGYPNRFNVLFFMPGLEERPAEVDQGDPQGLRDA